MRNDQETSPGLAEGTPPDLPGPARTRPGWPSTATLALLMAGTSWAVASWVSAWLVLPYLILMALLLFPPSGRLQADPVEVGPDASKVGPPARPEDDLAEPDPDLDGSASAEPSEGGSESGNPSSPTKARRGKGRVRKARPLPEPVEATWVQVAPGKFVRVEASERSPSAGPHAPWGVPVEAPTTPQGPESSGGAALGEPQEEAQPAFDAVGGRLGGPTGGVESDSCPAAEVDERVETLGLVEGSPAADGNAPQSGGWLYEPGASGTGVAPGAMLNRAEAESSGAGSEDGAERSPPTDDPEPLAGPAPADVPPEDLEEWGETFEATDPTETPVDETVLDDAGRSVTDPGDLDAPRDVDSSEERPFPASPGGSTWRPWRLAPRDRARGGPPPRSVGREAAPRRLVRSSRAPRRPTDPRRLTRRGLGRPRQITRTFPPRSPPRQPAGRRGLGLFWDQKSWQ